MDTVTFVIQVVFALVGVNFIVLTWFVLKTRNGLKVEFLVFFIALAWSALLRMAEPVLTAAGLPPSTVSLCVGVPILVTGTKLVWHLARKGK